MTTINPNEAAALETFRSVPADMLELMAVPGQEGSFHRMLWEVNKAFSVALGRELDRGAKPAELLWASAQIVGNLAATAVDTFALEDRKHEAFHRVLAHVVAAQDLLHKPATFNITIKMPGRA